MTGKATEVRKLTFRRFESGQTMWQWDDLTEKIFQADHSYKCPTYVHRTPPCQGSCPSGHDIRGWLAIARGMDKPPVAGMAWQEYAFQKHARGEPFPSVMGRVCPAPCEDGCNRNEVDDFVGINAVEQYVGDWAIEHKLAPLAGAGTGTSGSPSSAAVRPVFRLRISCAARATRVIDLRSPRPAWRHDALRHSRLPHAARHARRRDRRASWRWAASRCASERGSAATFRIGGA